MSENAKRGANGGVARKAKLSPERRREIAQEAAKKRWEKKGNGASIQTIATAKTVEIGPTTIETFFEQPAAPVIGTLSEAALEDTCPKHCPACLNGQSLEEGEGTHILATVEHPVMLPAGFEDAEQAVVVPAAPVPPQKPHKPTPAEKGRKRASKDKPVSKVYGQALAIAEREYAETVEELAYHDEMAARLKAKLPRLVQTIKALGGTIDPQLEMQPQNYPNAAYIPNGGVPYMPSTPPQLPPQYPEYAQPQATAPVVAQVRPMRSGGAGVAMG